MPPMNFSTMLGSVTYLFTDYYNNYIEGAGIDMIN